MIIGDLHNSATSPCSAAAPTTKGLAPGDTNGMANYLVGDAVAPT